MSHSQTRQQVAEYLTQHGPLEDAKGERRPNSWRPSAMRAQLQTLPS
jgi:hypothetical protein